MTYYFNKVYINEKYSFLASDKYSPVIMDNVDEFENDYYLKKKTIELAEIEFQRKVLNGLLEKCKLGKKDIDLLIGGDLQNQILASTIASSGTDISTLGIYSACASFVEGIIIGSMFLNSEKNSKIVITSSSHNLVSEKQFRFPVEYGAVRRRVNTCTASGSIGILLSCKKSNIKVDCATIGSVIQTNHKDANDMGSAMASACVDTLIKHLNDTKRDYNYYDLILTGDLGIYGKKIVERVYKEIKNIQLKNVIDAGSIFYEDENIYAGASGPVCLPLVFFDYILKQKKYKKILIIGTGSLHSVTSTNLGIPIPSIAHAISLEVKY